MLYRLCACFVMILFGLLVYRGLIRSYLFNKLITGLIPPSGTDQEIIGELNGLKSKAQTRIEGNEQEINRQLKSNEVLRRHI